MSQGPTATTYYMHDPMTGMYSERVVSGSTTTWSDYVIVPGAGIVAVRIKTGGTVLWRYVGVDHLGSVATLTDASLGTVLERNSYDAWGKRRNADGSDNVTCSITSQVSRGFTGHEMLGSFCLINMNARLYDPSLGRFMGADSIVPDAMRTQDHNRYSYVDNNPLAFTDPSGHEDIETVVVTGERESDPIPGVSNDLAWSSFGGDNADAWKFRRGIETVVVTAKRLSPPPILGLFNASFSPPPISTQVNNKNSCPVPQVSVYGGLTGHYQAGSAIAGTASVGVIVDATGSMAIYATGGVGYGAAPTGGGYGAIDVGGMNGLTQDIQGPFSAFNGSISDGEGPGAETFFGQGSHGQPILGLGGSWGLGGGATTFGGGTYTFVSPPMSAGPLLDTIAPGLGYLADRFSPKLRAMCGE